MTDEIDFSSNNRFANTPSAQSIENTFRMAQVLQKKKEYRTAIDKYLIVCEQTERVLIMNPGANVEIHWSVFSLGYISDIYAELKDYNKAVAFRNAQTAFLEFMQSQKGGRNKDDSDDEQDIFTVATLGHTYVRLFKKVHDAKDVEEKPPEDTPEQLLKKLQDARRQDEENKIEETIRLLNEAAEQNELEYKRSFWKRNMRRITDHPVIFVIIVLTIAISVLLFIKFRPKKKINIPGGIDAQIAYLEKYVKDYEKKHGKRPPTKRPTPRPRDPNQYSQMFDL